MPTSRVRLAELVATMSIVSDLGMGRPVERVLRQTVIAMRIAEAAGVPAEVRTATYYTSLLTWVGCGADTSELADLFGEEADLYADTHDDDLGGLGMAVFVARHLGRGSSPVRRIGMVGRFLATAGRSVQAVMESHCQAASDLAGRLGLGADIQDPLRHAFERWDGKGVPGRVGADAIAPAMRIVHVADNVEAFHHTERGGRPRSRSPGGAAARSSTPGSSTRFCDHAEDVLAGLDEISAWDEVIALDPTLGLELDDDGLDDALAALGDFADLKAPDPARPLPRGRRPVPGRRDHAPARGRRRRCSCTAPRSSTTSA